MQDSDCLRLGGIKERQEGDAPRQAVHGRYLGQQRRQGAGHMIWVYPKKAVGDKHWFSIQGLMKT